jgi:hypothetical protein
LDITTNKESGLIARQLKTPRAAAMAGIIFSVLFVSSQLLIRRSVVLSPPQSVAEVESRSTEISRALNLVPFAGIAFLWFIAVFRDHWGELEDRFFATVFLGSGLLYLAMIFASAALAGGLLRVLNNGSANLVQSGAYALSRAQMGQLMNLYAIKMAGVFMITSSTIAVRTRIVPRPMALLGYVLALAMLVSSGSIEWIPLVFPTWVFLMSVFILIERLGSNPMRKDS